LAGRAGEQLMIDDPSNLGPLPKGDRSDELQQLSFAALQSSIPVESFRFRRDVADDKGRDGVLECKSAGRFTGFEAWVQLKGTDSDELNADGSFSLRVAASNLNYLLNGPCPLYILWIAPRNELRYVWGMEEAARLERENPNWQAQETITLRLSRILTSSEWHTVYEHVLDRGRGDRQLKDLLARGTINEPLVVSIDRTTLAVSDPEQIYSLLKTSGMAIVGCGYAQYVLDQTRLLSSTRAAEPRLQLVCAYAYVTLGQYLPGLHHTALARASEATLSLVDRFFLRGVQLACEFQIGRVDKDAFLQAQEALERDAPPELAIQFKVDRLRLAHLQERDPVRRASLFKDLEEAATQLENESYPSTSLKLQVRLGRLYAQAIEANANYLHVITRIASRRDMGFNPATRSSLSDLHRARQTDERLDAEIASVIQAAANE
jgi:hypothetical protein